ncbi:hypothetical protein [Photobacterium galatheae]|uniref:Uncharacterized protein n=1 Tax=Photobacterium galatheae TaxID=1654360 RepID=A0A066RVX1_9GAMM|nr:hypothetical protein [Photobacterium galatheae]KDM91533.1 hypothetical protein EA58_10945 [Photobacterium galatheae]MCM0149606.1 hypothetical protein [Photobacterium galatheae]
MSEILEFPSNYYIFSAFFEKSKSDSGLEISDMKNKYTLEYKYENFHKLSDDTESVRLKNVRPLSFIPVISESADGVDNTAAEQWRSLTNTQREDVVKDWIENQPTVVEAPMILERPAPQVNPVNHPISR